MRPVVNIIYRLPITYFTDLTSNGDNNENPFSWKEKNIKVNRGSFTQIMIVFKNPSKILYGSSYSISLNWGWVNEVEQSCFKSCVYWIKVPPPKVFPCKGVQGMSHDHGELCKYGHIRQATGTPSAYPWNKQTNMKL